MLLNKLIIQVIASFNNITQNLKLTKNKEDAEIKFCP